MSRISIDEYYLNIAKAVAQRSTCIRRKYGAVLVKNAEIIGTGYNGSPRGQVNCCDTSQCFRTGHAHNDGDYSQCPAVHAEMNCLLSVARKDSIGATLYLYGEDNGLAVDADPCPVCKNLIKNAGIKTFVGSRRDRGKCKHCVHAELRSDEFPCSECKQINNGPDDMYIMR